MVVTWKVCKIQVSAFFETYDKKAPQDPPRGGKMEAKIAPGRPQDDEKWSKNFSGAPPGQNQ